MNAGAAALNRPVMAKHEVSMEECHASRHSLVSLRWHMDEPWPCSARMHILRRATNMHRSGENDNVTNREVLLAAGCFSIDVQVAMLRLLFSARLVRWRTAPLSCRLVMGMSALRRDLAWLYKVESTQR